LLSPLLQKIARAIVEPTDKHRMEPLEVLQRPQALLGYEQAVEPDQSGFPDAL
jgi:hypothetical protein